MFNKGNSLFFVMMLFATGCAVFPGPEAQDTPTRVSANATHSDNTGAPASWCVNLNETGGLPGAASLADTHVLYLGIKHETGSETTQIGAIAVGNGSEKVLFTGASGFRGIGFLQDGYHFLAIGPEISDLDGTPLRQADPIEYLQDFPLFSPMWNLLASGPDATLNQYDQNGNGFSLASPDGRHIAIWGPLFESNVGNGEYPLKITNRSGGEMVEVLRSGPGETIQGNWSPDGHHFVFTWYKNAADGYSTVYIIDSDGANLTSLSEQFERETLERPRWSPHGSKIAIPIWARGGGMDILVVDFLTGGTNRFQVSPIVKLDSIMDQGEMAWSPDDEWFAYISMSEAHRGIEILNTSTGQIYCGQDDRTIGIEMMDWR